MFKERSYAVGVFLMTVMGFVLYGSLVLLPIMLQTLLGYPPMLAGIAMAPRGIGSFFLMPITGLLTGRFDPRKLLSLGFLIGGITLLWLSRLNLQAGYWDIFWPQLIQGASLSLLFVPLTTASMSAISREKMGNATSLFNLMRNIGGSIGIAVTGTMLVRQQQAVTTLLGSHVTRLRPGQPGHVRADPRRVHRRGRRPGDRDEPDLRRALRDRLAAGVDGVVRHDLPDPGIGLHRPDSARADHEAPGSSGRRRRGGH